MVETTASTTGRSTPSSPPISPRSSNKTDLNPLQHTWCLYLHYPMATSNAEKYSDANASLCTFGTVEDFWRYYMFIPVPADLFTNSRGQRRRLDDKVVEGIGIFKEGISPQWEDPANAQGGHWEARFRFPEGPSDQGFKLEDLNDYWERMLLGLIGETLELGTTITGARVVDKCKGNKYEYRLELWTSTKDMAINDRIRDKVMDCLAAPLPPPSAFSSQQYQSPSPPQLPEFAWKPH